MRIKLILVTVMAVLGSLSLNAQTNLKIGWTNIDHILQNLPDAANIQEALNTERAQYEKLFNEKLEEGQKMMDDYQKNAATMSDIIRQDKERSIQNKQRELQELQQNSETALQSKQQELLTPVMNKIQTAIDDVAKEKGYAYVLNSDAGFGTTPVLLVAPEEDNITEAVLKKLGVELSAGN